MLEQYNVVNITLDVFSAVLTIMIGIYLISRRNDTKENRYFLWICIWNLFFILGDLSDWCCNGLAHAWYPVALHVGQIIYYVVLIPFLYTMMKYVCAYLSAYGKVPGAYMQATVLLAGLHFVGCVLTQFNGLFYYISEENIYYIGKGVLLASIFPAIVYVMITILTISFRKLLCKRSLIALLSYVWIPLLGQVIQYFFRGVATLNAAITLAILFMFFNVQLDRDVQYEKDKQELMEANIKVMLGQIKPHFLYNTLAAIRGLCDTAPEKAKSSINDFSIFLRANMTSLSNDKAIPFEQELAHVKSYLNLIQQMYMDEIKVEYDIQATDFCIPALSLQPLVENAVHKGIRKKGTEGTIIIHTEETKQGFKIVISDDGVGFHTDILNEEGHLGIRNVKKRIEVMCGGTVSIESTIGKGTTVLVNIPKFGGGWSFA